MSKVRYAKELVLHSKRNLEVKVPMDAITSSMNATISFRKIIGYDMEVRECFIVLYLNSLNKILGYSIESTGGISQTIVDVRLLFAKALQSGCTQIIVAHNHPSGGLEPSKQDKYITEKIKDSGKILNINLLDHLIITEESFYSFADNELL